MNTLATKILEELPRYATLLTTSHDFRVRTLSRYQNCSRTLHASQSQLLYLHTELIEILRENFMTWRHYRSSRSLSTHRWKLLKLEIRKACIRRRGLAKSKVGALSQEIREGHHDISQTLRVFLRPMRHPIHLKFI